MTDRPTRAARNVPRGGIRRSCKRASVRAAVHLAGGIGHAVRGSVSSALIDAARSCSCDDCPGWIRRLEAEQRTARATRKRVKSTFALTSGAGRDDLGSVAPSTATGAADWKRTRAERAADALLGLQVPAPYRGTTTTEGKDDD